MGSISNSNPANVTPTRADRTNFETTLEENDQTFTPPPPPTTFEGDDDVDVMNGTQKDETFHGHGGNDIIFGEGGNDIIHGGDGDDHLYGGTGNDILAGDAGNDVMVGGTGNDTIWGGDGDDTIVTGDGDDYAHGGAGNDTMSGNGGTNYLDGGEGDDIIAGFGNTTMVGGLGKDTMYSSGVNDTFVIYDISQSPASNPDEIILEESSDNAKVDFNNMIFNGQSLSPLTWSNEFTGQVGQVVLEQLPPQPGSDATHFTLSIDADGDGIADLQVNITDKTNSFGQGDVLGVGYPPNQVPPPAS